MKVDALSKYYSDEQLNQVINVKPKNRITIGYCRISNHKQKDDLERQIDNVRIYLQAKGQPFEIISDIGSGINYKENKLQYAGASRFAYNWVLASEEENYEKGGRSRTQKVKKLEKQKRRLQRSLSRSYEKNKKGVSYCKTNNVIKKEKLLLKRNNRLTNIRKNYLKKE